MKKHITLTHLHPGGVVASSFLLAIVKTETVISPHPSIPKDSSNVSYNNFTLQTHFLFSFKTKVSYRNYKPSHGSSIKIRRIYHTFVLPPPPFSCSWLPLFAWVMSICSHCLPTLEWIALNIRSSLCISSFKRFKKIISILLLTPNNYHCLNLSFLFTSLFSGFCFLVSSKEKILALKSTI